MMQINFHKPAAAKAWVPEHHNYGALEVIDQEGSKVTVYVDAGDKELLQQIITEAAKLLAKMEEPQA